MQGSTTNKNLTCPVCFESYEEHEDLKTHCLSIHEKKNYFQGKIFSKSFESELDKLKKESLYEGKQPEETTLVHEDKGFFCESSNPSKEKKKNYLKIISLLIQMGLLHALWKLSMGHVIK